MISKAPPKNLPRSFVSVTLVTALIHHHLLLDTHREHQNLDLFTFTFILDWRQKSFIILPMMLACLELASTKRIKSSVKDKYATSGQYIEI